MESTRINPFASAGEKKESQGGGADTADVHALKQALAPGKKNDSLASLFSRQGKRAISTKASPEDLEDRLRRHERRADAGASNREDHGEGQEDASPEEIARDVADHILVSDKDYMENGEDQQVRIKIREDILADAHIHMVRCGEVLRVKLMSRNEKSLHILVDTRGDLKARLKKNHKGTVEIEIIQINEKGEGCPVL